MGKEGTLLTDEGGDIGDDSGSQNPGAGGTDGGDSGGGVEAYGVKLPRGWMPQLRKDQVQNAELIKDLSQFEAYGDVVDAYSKMKTASASAPKKPESPEKYELAAELPEGMDRDDAFEKKFRQWAWDLGLGQETAGKLYKMYNDEIAERFTAEAAQYKRNREESLKALRNEWGGDFEKNLTLAKRAFSSLGGMELKELLDETGLGDDPVFLKTFYHIGSVIGEDILVRGDKGGAKGKTGGVDYDEVYPSMKGMPDRQ